MTEHDFTRHKIFTSKSEGGLTTEPSIPFTSQRSIFGYVGPRDKSGALSYRLMAQIDDILREARDNVSAPLDIELIELQALADFDRHNSIKERPEFFYVWFQHFYVDLLDGIHNSKDFYSYITLPQSEDYRFKDESDWGVFRVIQFADRCKSLNEFELMPEETTLILTKELLYELESGKYRLDP